MSRPFIFSIILPILFFLIVLHKHHQLSSSLTIQLDQLNSRLSVLESIVEKSEHDWRSKDECSVVDDIAQIKKMILEKEETIASLQNTIRSNQEWIQVLKNKTLTFLSNLKPHFGFLSAKTTEAYHASKNTSEPFFRKLYKSANRI